jgi:Holliday junction resolvasome RuvABC DNA-binding subunit
MLALTALGISEDAARAKVQKVLAENPSLTDTQNVIKKALAG